MCKIKKLAIITTHPVQYNAPFFKLLAQKKEIEVKVFYTWGQAKDKVYDPGFGKERNWDIPLLEGYEYEFLENISKQPGSHHFKGIDNPDIIERVLQFNPYAILVFGWSFKSHLKVIRYFHGKKPILFRGDSTLIDEVKQSFIKVKARRLFLKWVYSHIDYALFTGQANHEYFLKHGLKNNQLIFAPHSVDNSRYADDQNIFQEKADRWRKELCIPEDAVVFLFAGKFEEKKDPSILINAFMQTGNPRFRLLIIGNGVLEDELKQKAKTDSRILFLDFQNQQNMPVVYRLCDIFVLPSKGPGETWGLAVNEAMACSKAVIVSNVCGCARDLVKEGINGMVIDAGNEKNLLAALNFFANDQCMAYKFGVKGKEIIDDWNYNNIIGSINRVIKIN